VRKLSLALDALALEGRLHCLGGGMWADAQATGSPGHATPEDGRSVARLHETLARMLHDGLLAQAREHCYALTEAAVEAEERRGLAPEQERALATLCPDSPLRSDEVAARCGDNVRAVRVTLRGLLALGLVRETRSRGRRVYVPGDPARMLAVRGLGPAARKALERMAAPASYDDLATALGVSRERARQLAAKLARLGLAAALPASPSSPALFIASSGGTAAGTVSMNTMTMQPNSVPNPVQ
jgi:predicted transcriptional regulator